MFLAFGAGRVFCFPRISQRPQANPKSSNPHPIPLDASAQKADGFGWVEDGCPKPSLQCQRERLQRSPFSQCGPRISCELDRLPKLLLLQPRHLLPYARGSCTLISLPRALSGFVQVRALGGLGFRDLGLSFPGTGLRLPA